MTVVPGDDVSAGPSALQHAFAATLVDEWVRAGVRHAVLAPGSRSTPIALALLAEERLSLDVRLDERSAGFFALGLALATRTPVVVATTSGTAAAELHPAVCEADLAGVPLVVVTADRPVELQRVGAPQTIEQHGLYGQAVRFFAAPGVADAAARPAWRSLASRLVLEASGGPRGPGPVHANLAQREPFHAGASGAAADALVPPGRPGATPWHVARRDAGVSASALEAFDAELGRARRGLFVAGEGAGDAAVRALATRLGWPVLADPRAWPRVPDGVSIAAYDSLLRSGDLARALTPDLVVHLGAPPASKVLATWCASLAHDGVRQVLVDPYGRFADPERHADVVLAAAPEALALASALTAGSGAEGDWLARWLACDAAAGEAFDALLAAPAWLSEPGLARGLFAALPAESTLFVSSSMPVRDIEWFAGPRAAAPRVLANRGANGIDGVTSTVLGVARAHLAHEGPVVGLLGDLAFCHDLSGLVTGALERELDAVLVVVDNGGGGIFSFLPVATELDGARFRRAFATPQSLDIAAVARALGCGVLEVGGSDSISDALADASGERGVQVLHCRTERDANVDDHRRWHAAAAEAGAAALWRALP